MKPRLLILCNALDDATRQQRGITTDSPAASRKVFMLCQALRMAGVRPCIVSLGRGKAGGSAAFFSSVCRRVNGVPVFYAPFSRIPFVSELISLLAPLGIIFKLRRENPKAIIFYNRLPAYVPALLLSAILKYRNILDLEDGEINHMALVPRLFDQLCSGALLACSALASHTKTRPVRCYYGTAVHEHTPEKWRGEYITVLMGGALSSDTGAELLIDTIRQIRRDAPAWAAQLRFEITGKGSSLEGLLALAAEPGFPKVIVHGRLTDREYRQVLNHCDVGLALKLNTGPLAHTTFPSKVIEFAAAGTLVLTTDISDVRQIFSDGAVYLTRDDSRMLTGLLEKIVTSRSWSRECAQRGMQNVQALCAPRSSGKMIADFIFGERR